MRRRQMLKTDRRWQHPWLRIKRLVRIVVSTRMAQALNADAAHVVGAVLIRLVVRPELT